MAHDFEGEAMRYREAGFVGIVLCMTIVASCTLEESKYERYRQKNGGFEYCPPQNAEAGSRLSKVIYTEAVGNGLATSKTCDSSNCPADYLLAFEGSICPVDFRCEQGDTEKEYVCTNVLSYACGDGETGNSNVVKCGNECVDITLDPNNCGGCGIECKADETSHALEFSCEKGNCIPKSCETGYHLSDSTCKEDTADACGSGKIDCTQIQGWKESKCEHGACVATDCSENFHLNGKVCEVDSVMSCGVDKIACDTTEGDGIETIACIKGKCKIVSCEANYHRDAADQSCEADSPSACGSWNNTCSAKAGWSDGNCTNGQCNATACKSGFHLNRGSCEPDTSLACGNDGTNCEALDRICSGGECVSDCPTGEEKCSDGCFDLSGDVNHCGDCNTKCLSGDFLHMTTSCKGGKCEYQCIAGYGNCDNDWSNGCETDLNEKNLKDNNDGTCSCTDNYINCGTITTDSQVEVPLCIDELSKYHLNNAGGRCACKERYSQCGSTRSANGKRIPLCIENASDYHLVSRSDDTCGCEDSYTQCGTRKLSDGTSVPVCIGNEQFSNNDAFKGLERKSDGTCGCIDGYSSCGRNELSVNYSGEWFTALGTPLCIRDASDYGLEENGDGRCVCEPTYTACGTIEADIGYNKLVRIPLCLRQGDYYSNYPITQSYSSGDFINNHNGVPYNYKSNKGCDLRMSSYKDPYNNYQWGGYKNFHRQNTGWQGKDKWSAETCAVLCNSEQHFDNNNPNNYVSNANVSFTLAHRCKAKATCNQFDTYDEWNNYYYDYGCEDGGNGYYHTENCRD